MEEWYRKEFVRKVTKKEGKKGRGDDAALGRIRKRKKKRRKKRGRRKIGCR